MNLASTRVAALRRVSVVRAVVEEPIEQRLPDEDLGVGRGEEVGMSEVEGPLGVREELHRERIDVPARGERRRVVVRGCPSGRAYAEDWKGDRSEVVVERHVDLVTPRLRQVEQGGQRHEGRSRPEHVHEESGIGEPQTDRDREGRELSAHEVPGIVKRAR